MVCLLDKLLMMQSTSNQTMSTHMKVKCIIIYLHELRVHTCMCAYMHVCIHACVHTCMCAYMHVCIHACVHTCMCAFNNPITRVSHNALCPADLDQELYQIH